MSTLDPEDGVDWAALEESFEGVDFDGQSVTMLTDLALLDRYQEITAQLFARKEARFPKTQEARDLHSERAALLIEIRKRKIM